MTALVRLRVVMVVMGAAFVAIGSVAYLTDFVLFALVALVYGGTTALWGVLLSWVVRA